MQNPDPSENVIAQRPEPARKSNVYTSILESGKSAMEKMSIPTGDVVARGDQSSGDSVYEVKNNDWFYIS